MKRAFFLLCISVLFLFYSGCGNKSTGADQSNETERETASVSFIVK
jgi:hypothetical protein